MAGRIIELAPVDEQDALTRLSGAGADLEIEPKSLVSAVDEVESPSTRESLSLR